MVVGVVDSVVVVKVVVALVDAIVGNWQGGHVLLRAVITSNMNYVIIISTITRSRVQYFL